MGSIERLLLYYNEKDMLKNKESGEPDSRAEARLLQHPYFLSAKCASCPEGFLCNRSTFLLHKKLISMDRLDPRKSALLFYQEMSLMAAAFLPHSSYRLPQLHNPVKICVFQQFFQTKLRFS